MAGEAPADPDSRILLEEESRILRARLAEVEALLAREEAAPEKSGSDSPGEPEDSASL